MPDAPSQIRRRFTVFPVLSSDRLVLREVLEDDAPFIVDISFYDGKAAKNERQAKAMLRKVDADVARGESIHWGVTLKIGRGVIGTCGFYRGFGEHRGEIGYVLKEAYQGQGIMTEALEQVIKYGFEHLALSEIVAYTDEDNVKSAGVLTRSSFEAVGHHDGYLKFLRRR